MGALTGKVRNGFLSPFRALRVPCELVPPLFSNPAKPDLPDPLMLHVRLTDEPRSVTYSILAGVWAIVALYAIAHDQYIVRIAPEHFTIYHEPLWGIANPKWLAAAYALRASIGPGFVLGFACVIVGRNGSRPKVSKWALFAGTAAVVAATEIVSAGSGWWTDRTKRELFPHAWYPDATLPLRITTTMQITCYLASAFFSLVFLLIVNRQRSRLALKN